MMAQNTKKEILIMAVDITKARMTTLSNNEYSDSRNAEKAVTYLETIYKGIKKLCEKEGIN